jgi:hypothetical protein
VLPLYCNNNNKHEPAYAGTGDCFTHLRVLLVLQAPRHWAQSSQRRLYWAELSLILSISPAGDGWHERVPRRSVPHLALGRQLRSLTFGHVSLQEVDGMSAFRGEAFHTSRWPDNCDLAGKTVGVVGTGASAAQVKTPQNTLRHKHDN